MGLNTGRVQVRGTVVLITGGAQGIGAATAQQCLADGATVVVADIRGDAAGDLATSLGDDAHAVQLDVTDEHAWSRVVAGVERDIGPIGALVNNAGVMTYGSIEDTDVAEMRRVLDVDLVGTFLGMRAVIPVMKSRRAGSIVNLSS
ncbi:MAG TPA: SDR family NAD(P)-dependent oxidoreductase, partial [Ilumatobacteraceae bacterium]